MQFRVLYLPAFSRNSEAVSVPIDAVDIDAAAAAAIEQCKDDEYVAGVWQADIPGALIAWHATVDEVGGADAGRAWSPGGVA